MNLPVCVDPDCPNKAKVDELERKLAEIRACVAGEIPPGLKFVLDVETGKRVDPIVAKNVRLRAAVQFALDHLEHDATTTEAISRLQRTNWLKFARMAREAMKE